MKIKEGAAIACAMFSSAIAATTYAFVFSKDNAVAMYASQGLVIGMPLVIMLFNPKHIKFNKNNILLCQIFTIVLFLNLGVNAGTYAGDLESFKFAAAHAIGLIMLFLAIQWAVVNFDPERIMRIVAWELTPLICLAILDARSGIGNSRSAPFGVHPNWWGELLFTFVVCSLTLERTAVRWMFISLGLFLFYLVQSRGGLLAATVSILCYLILKIYPEIHRSKNSVLYFCVSILVVSIVAIIFPDQLSLLSQFIVDDVLLWNDPYRGEGTGFTDRESGWLTSLDVFYQNPVFGQGLDTLGDVHNGFLRLAGEGGLVLLSMVLWAMINALIRAWKVRNHVVIFIIVGYSALISFAPRMLNMNIASMIFFIALFRWKSPSPPGKGRAELTILPFGKMNHSE